MVSNFESIFVEITRQSDLIGRDHDVLGRTLATLVMEIVDAEDRNQLKPFAVNKTIENMISQAARANSKTGSA